MASRSTRSYGGGVTKADKESRRRLFNHVFHDLLDSPFLASYNEVNQAGCAPRAERRRDVAGGGVTGDPPSRSSPPSHKVSPSPPFTRSLSI